MTSLISALIIALSSMGYPGLELNTLDANDPVPCSAVETPSEGNEVPWGPAAGPDSRKISNGF